MTRAGTEQAFAVLFAVLMVTSMIAGAIAVSGGVAAAPGDVAHRVNAGGSTVGAADGGPDWSGDYSQYVSGGEAYTTGDSITLDGSVPSGTPTETYWL